MSLHAELNTTVKEELGKQRRRATLSSVVIALLSCALMMILLALWSLVPLLIETPTIVGYSVQPSEETETTRPVVPQSTQSKPSAPSMAASRVIASTAPADVAFMTPEFDPKSLELDSGTGHDFGAGFGEMGFGGGDGSSTGFGSSGTLSSALRGYLYDFKQNDEGESNKDYFKNGRKYAEYVVKIEKRRFSESALSDYYKAPQQLSLTNLAIANAPAADGPKYFNAENEVEPRGWMAHYQGIITVPEDGEYRLVGFADDYLLVNLNNRTRLIASWPGLQESVRGRWRGTEPHNKWLSPIGNQHLIAGDWMKLKRGDEMKMDLAVGERPGGRVGFILMVEKKGENYKKTPNGRPILPLFTTTPFSADAQKKIQDQFPNYPFEWEKVPVFSAR